MSLPFIYKLSPFFIQNLLINLKGLIIVRRRFNSVFYSELEKFNKSNPNIVDVEQLRIFLKEANKTIFWKERFELYKLDLNTIDIIQEIKKLPILTKKEVVENIEKFKNIHLQEADFEVCTSGTTGSGMVFHQTLKMENKQWAVWWRFRMNFGINIDSWMAWFGGESIVPIEQTKKPFWRVNYFGKQLMFSSHHLNIDTVDYYYNKLKRSKIKWIHGYPSQISYFASLIKLKELEPLTIKFITLGAENLLDYQKEIIKEIFSTYPIQHYGLAEGVSNISQLPSGKFQIDQDFAYTELINASFDENIYRIIGTNYSNIAFPLIRYDTNDLVKLDISGNIISIEGRNEDFITLPNGTKLGRLDHIFKKANYVSEAQIYQPSLNKIIIRIVKG